MSDITANLLTAHYGIANPGNSGLLVADRGNGICHIITTASTAITVEAPYKPGIYLTIILEVDGGNCGLTFADGINATGNDLASMGDAGDLLHLISVTDASADTGHKWWLINNLGCSLSTS